MTPQSQTENLAATRPTPRWRRSIRRTLITVTIAYVLTAALLYFFQTPLIFPGSFLHGTETTRVTPAPDERLLRLPTPSGEIAALYSPALAQNGRSLPNPATRPTVIYFYGNGESVRFALAESDILRRMGYNVLLPDYPGYGMSAGRPSATAVYNTADACYAHLTETLNVPPHNIAVIGRSLGGSAAIYLAARHDVGALATLSTFRSLHEIASNAVHHLFPVRLLVRHRLDNLSRMPDVHCPTFIAHGTNDELIPFNSAASLSQATSAATTLYPVSGATHNDIYDVGSQPLLDALGQFLGDAFDEK